ncbi:MAG: family 78 glycoside hydrolase catalytic domain [Saccharofermentanales bacterium]
MKYAYDLTVEFFTNPMGINTVKPVLAWKIKDDDKGAKQTAYQVIAATSVKDLAEGRCDLWDSSKVMTDQSQQIIYDGKPLESKAKVFWQVRFWDKNDVASGFSEINQWEMGLLADSDWHAKWIEAPDMIYQKDEILGKWIWQYSMHTAFIRKTFDIRPEGIKNAIFKIEADNGFRLYVNGVEVQFNENNGIDRKAITFDITPMVCSGSNLIAIRATQTAHPEWFMSGIRAGLAVEYNDDSKDFVKTDESWRMAVLNWDRLVKVVDSENWYTVDYESKFWMAPEICNDIHPRDKRRPHYFRKSFNLSGKPAEARVYITAHGLYVLYINGVKAGNDMFTPGVTESRPAGSWFAMSMQKQPYQIYDITEMLAEGENVIGVICAGGFWNGWAHSFLMDFKPELLMQLTAEYENGESVEIISDGSFSTFPSPVVEDSFMYGERYDARLEINDWNSSGLDMSAWRKADVVEHMYRLIPFFANCMETVQEQRRISAISMKETGGGIFEFDFGANEVGRCSVRITGSKPGDKILLRYAEHLKPDGTLDDSNYRDVMGCDHEAPFMSKNYDMYICRGEETEIFEPRFAYTGFRYVEISGYPGVPEKDAVKLRLIHTKLKECGDFECDNRLLNAIWDSTKRSLIGNMFDVPTDCPTREKMAWTGDAQNIAQTAAWYLNIVNFFKKFTSNGPKLELTSVGWADEEIIIPWRLYSFYGDKQVLADNYHKAAALIDKRLAQSVNYIYKGQAFEWGDHVAIEKTAGGVMASAYFYYNVIIAAEMAKALDIVSDNVKYLDLAAKIADAFNKEYLNDDYSYGTGTQASMIFPLAFGLVPDDIKSKVTDALLKAIHKSDDHLATGFSSTEFLLPVLTDGGQLETAYKIINQTTYPSWGYFIVNGATTIWESWHMKGGSANHYALGNVSRWFFEYLAGVRLMPQNPGFKRFIVKPYFPEGLSKVKMRYESVYGMIESSWEKIEGKVAQIIEIPPNTSAEIYFPAESDIIANGKDIKANDFITQISSDNGFDIYEFGAGRYMIESVKGN